MLPGVAPMQGSPLGAVRCTPRLGGQCLPLLVAALATLDGGCGRIVFGTLRWLHRDNSPATVGSFQLGGVFCCLSSGRRIACSGCGVSTRVRCNRCRTCIAKVSVSRCSGSSKRAEQKRQVTTQQYPNQTKKYAGSKNKKPGF